MKLRYWDSVVWLGILKEEPNKVATCTHLLQQAQAGDFKIVISAITLTEVVHLHSFQRLSPEKEETIKAFFEHDFIIVRAVDRITAELARELMWRYKDQALRPKDALHVATACLANVDILNSYDDDLVKLNQQIARKDGELLTIARPFISQVPLLTPSLPEPMEIVVPQNKNILSKEQSNKELTNPVQASLTFPSDKPNDVQKN